MDISEAQRVEIGQTIEAFRQMRAYVKWVRPENLHITLKFLGDVNEDSIYTIAQKLTELSAVHAALQVKLKTIGAFPSLKRPNALWIGITKTPALEALHCGIEEAMSQAGFKKEDRPFTPHLTIARVKGMRDYHGLYEKINAVSGKDFGKSDAAEIVLMQSDLMPGGAKYMRLKSFPFGK
jgi:2'-5' RNA ligase